MILLHKISQIYFHNTYRHVAMCKKSIGDESEVDVINIFFYWRCVFGWYEVHRCRLQLQKKEGAKYSCKLYREIYTRIFLHQNTHLVETLLSSHGTGRDCPPLFNLCDQSFIHTPARETEIPGKKPNTSSESIASLLSPYKCCHLVENEAIALPTKIKVPLYSFYHLKLTFVHQNYIFKIWMNVSLYPCLI